MGKKKLILVVLVCMLLALIGTVYFQINHTQNENSGVFITKGGCASSEPGEVHPDYCVAPKTIQ